MNSRRSRSYRRVAQACENCRRKKIRCLGERPRCSTCTRLRQACHYAYPETSDVQFRDDAGSHVTNRLSQLEDKLDMILNNLEPQSTQEATPSSAAGSRPNASLHVTSPTTPKTNRPSSAPLPSEIITRAIDIYLRRVHRQPMWLFDTDSLPTADSSEELICSILALGLAYSADDFVDTDLQEPAFYSYNGRKLIMLKIADGSFSIQTIQSLCLLAFFNVTSGDLTTAGFNTTLAKNLMQLWTPSWTPNQERSRLFWSISLLDSYYGPHILVPTVPDYISPPRFSRVEPRYSIIPCPVLPQSSCTTEEVLPDVWSRSIQICCLWGDLRVYIARCFEGSIEQPWKPNSDYTTLCARLQDFEIGHPSELSYNAVKLPDRDPHDVQKDWPQWLPWMRLQVSYHAIHCVLNHPFLYSIDVPKEKLGTNTFWKESSEKALRNCTWVSRIIRIAGEKGLELSDPFFAQAATIAATLHLYWTRTHDTELRNAALASLEVCRSLLSNMASHWAVCRSLEHALNRFIHLVSLPEPESTSLAERTLIMWTMLDIATAQSPSHSRGRPFDKNMWGMGRDVTEYTAPDDNNIHTPPTDLRESTAHFASPPEWVSGAEPARPSATEEAGDSAFIRMESIQEDGTGSFELAWGPWEHILHSGENSMALNWWDFSNI